MSSYSEKLKDPRWQKRRLEILSRDDWTCQRCGAKHMTLHVHHDSYAGEPWESGDASLSTICEACHEAEHAAKTLVIVERSGREVSLSVDRARKLAFGILAECDRLDSCNGA